jgi:hypothetical protein
MIERQIEIKGRCIKRKRKRKRERQRQSETE